MDGKYKVSISGTCSIEIERSLTNLLDTRAGSQPADRDFGIAWECLDEVPEVAENLFFLEVSRKVERYEPRIEVNRIAFERADGSLVPHIYFQKGRVK